MADIRLADFWEAVKTRLNTLNMSKALGGINRVYKSGDDYSLPPVGATEDRPWGRVVVVGAQTVWPDIDVPNETRRVNWLVRAEVNDFSAVGYDPSVTLEAAQAEAYAQLQNWAPPAPFRAAFVEQPVYRWTSPQALPLYDEARGLWYNSSEYRCEMSAPANV